MPQSSELVLTAIVPASGVGSRMGLGTPKQYITIAGKTVLEHSLEKLLSIASIKKIVVVLAEQDKFWQDLEISSHPKIDTAVGGEERCQSVLSGLLTLKECLDSDKPTWVLVHDSVRPCVRKNDIEKLITTVVGENQRGGLLVAPIVDTVKRVVDGKVVETLDREELFAALTPQMYLFDDLLEGSKKAAADGEIFTDEAALMKNIGIDSRAVVGNSDNIKLTYPVDLENLERILNGQNDGGLT